MKVSDGCSPVKSRLALSVFVWLPYGCWSCLIYLKTDCQHVQKHVQRVRARMYSCDCECDQDVAWNQFSPKMASILSPFLDIEN